MKTIVAFFLLMTIVTHASAQEVDCYAKAKIPLEKRHYSGSIVLMLDETTVFDEQQRNHILEQTARLVTPGTELKAIAFSAYIGDRYTRTVLDFSLASPLDQETRDSTRKDSLREFDRCFRDGLANARIKTRNAVQSYLNSTSSNIAKSDILGALKEVAERVGPRLKNKKKIMFVLVSDMLENSNITSFYSNNDVRVIDPAKELALAEAKGMFTDFRQASVYVIGAGVLPPAVGKAAHYRPGVSTVLRAFWDGYFQKSNAKLAEFGAPLLLTSIPSAP